MSFSDLAVLLAQLLILNPAAGRPALVAHCGVGGGVLVTAADSLLDDTWAPSYTLGGLRPTCLTLSLLAGNTSGLWYKADFPFHVPSTAWCCQGSSQGTGTLGRHCTSELQVYSWGPMWHRRLSPSYILTTSSPLCALMGRPSPAFSSRL